MTQLGRDPVQVGAVLELDVVGVAHGGHCVARHDGQVVFVRHTLPGERVRAVVTSRTSRFLRADAVEVLDASAERVPAPCPQARPGGCGGCDWQHAALATQRALKASVVREQLRRLAGLDRDVVVQEVPGSPGGLGWRTRERFAVDAEGRAGLRRARSHDVLPLATCPLAHPRVLASGALTRRWPAADVVEVATSTSHDDTVVLVDGRPSGRPRVRHTVAGRTWRLSPGSFWQVHPGAAQVLRDTVLELLEPRAGEHAVDLYAGVGLFAAALAERVTATGHVEAVEASEVAVRDARRALHDLPFVRLVQQPVQAWLASGTTAGCDVVVLDPPRAGAGAGIVSGITGLDPRAVAYVACDPAALARDVAAFGEHGWSLVDLRAFDLFPMTHHVECVALLTRDTRSVIS